MECDNHLYHQLFMGRRVERKLLKLHLGAHKTATTHFQDTLLTLQPELQRIGINYELLAETRKRLSLARKYTRVLSFCQIPPTRLSSRMVSKKLIAPSQSLNKTSEVFLRSDENIIGSVRDACSFDIYHKSLKRIKFLNYIDPCFSVELNLSIRDLSEVFVGSYITYLRRNPERACHVKSRLMQDLLHNCQASWLPFIDKLSQYSNNKITVWSQEHYKNNSNQVISHFIGNDNIEIPLISPPKSTMTPSYKAIEKVETMMSQLKSKPKDWSQICDEIYQEYPVSESNEKFSFLNSKTKATLAECYKQDKSVIANNPNIAFLDEQ
jgi:hypothetical protein